MKNSISVHELKKSLNQPNRILFDATIPKVTLKTNSNTVEKKYIKGARFFDIKKVFSDQEHAMPNMLPNAQQFETECRKLGIHTSSEIVVYDDLGIYSSARVWWMFKTMGHLNVKVLDGGLPEWIKQGYETVSEVNQNTSVGDFKAHLNSDAVVDFNFIQSNIKSNTALVIDARSSDRFQALVPEPRADLRTGNIENSINIPYTDVLENGKLKAIDDLEKLFSNLKTEKRPLVFSCGSGITACIVSLAATSVLENKKMIYDGSWTEYAQLS